MKTRRTRLILILAVILAILGFLRWRSLAEEHAVTRVIHELERGIVNHNAQLVKSLYSEKVLSGDTVDQAEMMNQFLTMENLQNFHISDIGVVIRGPSAVAHFRVTGERVQDGKVVDAIDKKMMLQLTKSDGKWRIYAHGM